RLASLPARLGGRRLRAAVELASKEHRVAPPLLDAAAREAPQHAPAVIAFADAFAARPPAEARPDDARVLLGRGPAEVERRHGLEDLAAHADVPPDERAHRALVLAAFDVPHERELHVVEVVALAPLGVEDRHRRPCEIFADLV